MKLNTGICAILAGTLATLACVGCHNDDNRVLTTDQVSQAKSDNIKQIESLNIPEASKKELESHMGGAPYSNPAADQAKSHGVTVAPGTRQH
jgi:hypothetical protein